MVRETIRENELPTSSGGVAVVVFLLGLLGAVGGLAGAVATVNPVLGVGSVIFGVLMIVLLTGLFVVSPNEGAVLQLFGSYKGTARTTGLRWANPFFAKRHVSLK